MPKVDATMQFHALGTEWQILSDGIDSELTSQILTITSEFENNFSRFKSSSELSKLNSSKKAVNPSQEFVEMLRFALDTYVATHGLFNITITAELEKNGYGQSKEAAVISHSLTEDLIINDDMIMMSESIRLDFGGFGKGWLIDKIGYFLNQKGIDTFIINGGGDILTGHSAERLFIEHPFDAEQYIGDVVISGGALASSSRIKRAWKLPDGRTVDHIVDPFRQTNISHNIASMHVRASTALIADVFATVLLLATNEQSQQLINQFNLECMWVKHDLRYEQTPKFGFMANI